MSRRLLALVPVVCLGAAFGAGEEKSLNPQVQKIVAEISEARIKAIIEKLVSFGTRNTLSNPDDPEHGVGAARQWIFKELQSYSPRLQVRFDKWRVKKQGQRIFRDVDLYNVVAVLPGKRYPETEVVVSGHYDSLNLGNRPANAEPAGPSTDASAPPPQLTPEQFAANANLPAPGACDDGSGTAAVMELARIMSQYEFDKTLVFVAFAGEEQGLVGSTLMAAKAHKANEVIEAVLNNDIIGTDVAGNGRTGNTTVSVYSDQTMDSPSQQLSRYVREIAERYMPAMKVDTIFLEDRLARGGDHTPFQLEGYAAVRISTPNEIYANQHRATDTVENMSVPYTAKVAKINAAVAATLALAPKAPIVMREPRPPGANAPATPPSVPGARRPGPMISRGSGYDAVLQWRTTGPDENIKGYVIVIRQTTAPDWEREIYVGKVTRYTLKDVSIDDAKFGVKAIGMDGTASLVTPYVYPPRQKVEVQTTEQ